jgi:hypothetical protein
VRAVSRKLRLLRDIEYIISANLELPLPSWLALSEGGIRRMTSNEQNSRSHGRRGNPKIRH